MIRLAPALLLLALAACASPPPAEHPGPRTPADSLAEALRAAVSAPPAAASHPDRITRAEIEASKLGDAYALVQRLHPLWLRTRSGPGTIWVYVDNTRQGGTEVLRRTSLATVEEIRYVEPTRAGTLYGTDHGNGVILVFTRH